MEPFHDVVLWSCSIRLPVGAVPGQGEQAIVLAMLSFHERSRTLKWDNRTPISPHRFSVQYFLMERSLADGFQTLLQNLEQFFVIASCIGHDREIRNAGYEQMLMPL
jgi:hypothetical protein